MAKKKVSSRIGKKPAAAHGGGLAKGRRKTGRPLVENALTEVILSSSLAKGKRAFTKPDNYAAVEEILEARASEYRVKIESFEARGQELHLFVRFKSRTDFQGFLRVIAGLIARKVGQAKKGQPLPRKFWDHLAFTKTVESSDSSV
jgi:REP element-mobilizing transposase RayT